MDRDGGVMGMLMRFTILQGNKDMGRGGMGMSLEDSCY